MVKKMNKNNYKQYDTRWSKLGYPRKPWLIGNCGCGEVSICNSIIEISKYAKQTPKTIQPYCKQYASPDGDGTYFAGIPKMMKHYGMTEVKEHATMAQLWKELAKGDRVAIYLMGDRNGGSKGVHWTSGGHFVCSVKYKVKNGKHYVYVKDSNSTSSLRNGWITYEDNMRNDVSRVWSGKLPAKPKETMPAWVKKANAWAEKRADDPKAGYRKFKHGDKATYECLVCHPETDPKHKWYPFTWNCIGESFAYWHHGGGLPCNCSCHVIDDTFMTKLLTMNYKKAIKLLREKIGMKDIDLIRNNGKVIPQSKMKAGDLCITYDSNGKATHIYPYIGNGYMIDCGNWSDKKKQIARRKASPTRAIIRYTGK